ncbi:hypothetical protein D9756_000697 [Leucocoprinus leucothites]|uniref:Ubiquitin-like-conjugating enzyme ATG10 n=1 Tax=Leucocoprinus leucothites TaxID=201217 RepID=A0A8H5LNJ8_9AGAR|nr:hypothetical protein D9756_000697 [Leucoagaricus leucothites]
MLTRAQFDAACKALITRYTESASDFIAVSPLKGWAWNEHSTYPNFGFMSRTVTVFRRPDTSAHYFDDPLGEEVLEEEHDATVLSATSETESFTCQQYVVFSSTFRVPAFYFLLSDSSGSPLPLLEVLKTSLFKINAWDNPEVSSYTISLPTATFPLLSHGDHPTLGIPCWYFHPCETTAVVDELMREVAQDGWSEEARLARWLEMWFMVVCSVVNL